MILDANGKPFDKSTLEKSQLDETAQTQYLKNEFAGHLGKGLTPQRLNQILHRAEQGWILTNATFLRIWKSVTGIFALNYQNESGLFQA